MIPLLCDEKEIFIWKLFEYYAIKSLMCDELRHAFDILCILIQLTYVLIFIKLSLLGGEKMHFLRKSFEASCSATRGSSWNFYSLCHPPPLEVSCLVISAFSFQRFRRSSSELLLGDGRTDGRTDGPTDGRTDGRTDGGYHIIPAFSPKSAGILIKIPTFYGIYQSDQS